MIAITPMILSCPKCPAKYVIPDDALVPDGRAVKCSKCGHQWTEYPEVNDEHLSSTTLEEDTTPDLDTTDHDEHIPHDDQDTDLDIEDDRDINIEEPHITDSVSLETEEIHETQDDEQDLKDENIIKNPIIRPNRSVPTRSNNETRDKNVWGWASLAIFVIIFCVCLILFKSSIIEFWPASKRLYHTIGLANQTSLPLEKQTINAPQELAHEATDIKEKLTIGNISPKQEVKNNIITLIIEGQVTNKTNNIVDIPMLKAVIKNDDDKVIRSWNFSAERRIVKGRAQINFMTELPNPPENGTIVAVEFSDRG